MKESEAIIAEMEKVHLFVREKNVKYHLFSCKKQVTGGKKILLEKV